MRPGDAEGGVAQEVQRVGELEGRVGVDPYGVGADDPRQPEPEGAAQEDRQAQVGAQPPAGDDGGVGGVGADQLEAGRREKSERAGVQLDGGGVGVAGARAVGDVGAAGRPQLGIAGLGPHRTRRQQRPRHRREAGGDGGARTPHQREGSNASPPAEYSAGTGRTRRWTQTHQNEELGSTTDRHRAAGAVRALVAGGVRGDRSARAGGDAASADQHLGRGGGTWELALDGDRLRVEPPGREPPDIWIRLSVADLRVALGAADPDLPQIVHPDWTARHVLNVDPRDVDMVRQISGRLLLEIEGRRRRRFALDIGFGKAGVSAGRPRTTVRLDAPTFEGLRSGALPPMQPLIDGRIKLEGDRALAMQLMLLVGSRLGRR